MSYITTGERIGYERGKQQGEKRLILRLLQKRVGEIPEEVKNQVGTLSVEQLEALGEALLDFTVIDEVLNWLQAHHQN